MIVFGDEKISPRFGSLRLCSCSTEAYPAIDEPEQCCSRESYKRNMEEAAHATPEGKKRTLGVPMWLGCSNPRNKVPDLHLPNYLQSVLCSSRTQAIDQKTMQEESVSNFHMSWNTKSR